MTQKAKKDEGAIQAGTMRVHEAATFTGMKESTIRKLIRLKRLRVSRPNGCVLILREDLLRLLADGMK